MAGGGIGAPTTSTQPAAPVPSGAPLDGSPKFEAATPIAAGSSGTAATATSPATAAPAAPGTPFTGFPSWLGAMLGGWSGANYGTNAPTSGSTPSNYVPFVPGTSLAGYAGYRPPTIYTPPPKATPTPTTPAPTSIPEVWNPTWEERVGSIDPATGLLTAKQPTEDQRRMQQWLDMYTQQQRTAASSGNWGN